MVEDSKWVRVALWGVPWLHVPLAEHGIVRSDTSPIAAVVALGCDDDLEALRRLTAEFPGIVTLALIGRGTEIEDALRVVCMLEAGVSAVMPADLPPAMIADALRKALTQTVVIHPTAIQLLARGLRARADLRGRFSITARERDVLGLLVQGRRIAEIADCLGIGFHTVQTHVKNLYRKLDVGSKAEATALALRHQLV